MTDTVGFIGVGSMGAALASRFVDAGSLHVFDLNEASAHELVERGATFTLPRGMAAQCDLVFLSLPGPNEVERLLWGEEGIAEHLRPGTVLVDTTTSSPTLDARIAPSLRDGGVEFVDVGVAGGVRAAREGTASLMVGASAQTFVRVENALRQITSKVFHIGDVGSGHTMKLVNNMLGYCNRFAALECVHMAEQSGIDRDKAIEVLNESSGRNFTTQSTYVNLWDGQQWQPMGFTLDLVLKDIKLATALAANLDCPVPISTMIEAFATTAVERFGPKADQTKIMASWWDEPD